MKHLMIDLETLGTRPTSVFLSIAAVQFDLESWNLGEGFKENVEMKSACDAGLTIDASTLQWWMTQKPEIFKLMFEQPNELEYTLKNLSGFIVRNGIEYVWGNSARFDLSILENAYLKMGIAVPWNYRNERCYRTLTSLFPSIKPAFRKDAHDPTQDCLFQIERLRMVWRSIGNKEEPV
jgi:hypothetical protein